MVESAALAAGLHPSISKMWRQNWVDFTVMYESPEPIRHAIETTPAVEPAKSVIRKLTRNRKQNSGEESTSEEPYLAIHESSKR